MQEKEDKQNKDMRYEHCALFTMSFQKKKKKGIKLKSSRMIKQNNIKTINKAKKPPKNNNKNKQTKKTIKKKKND